MSDIVNEGGGVFTTAPFFSKGPQPFTSRLGNFSTGGRFVINVPGSKIAGGYFATAQAAPTTVRLKLLRVSTPPLYTHIDSVVASVDVPISGVGVYTGLFATPYTVPVGELGPSQIFAMLVWEFITGFYTDDRSFWWNDVGRLIGPSLMWINTPYFYVLGEALAGSDMIGTGVAQQYPVDPIVTCPF